MSVKGRNPFVDESGVKLREIDLRWWFQTLFYFHLYLQKLIQFDEHIIFVKWVES